MDLPAFITNKITITDTCWIWTGYKNAKGYGRVNYRHKLWLVHRLVWTTLKGEIPEGIQIDHYTCYNHACVNPEHLRLATPKMNSENKSKARFDSSTGVRGVTPNKNGFLASVGHNGKRIYLGTYKTVEEADAVVKEARKTLYT